MNATRGSLNNELFVKALENNIAIIRFDTSRRVTYVNDNFANVLGYRKEDIYGMKHSEFCFSDFVESPEYTKLWNNLLNGRSFQDKIIRKTVDDKIVWLEATYFPIYDRENDQVIGVAKVATDITERQVNIEKVTSDLVMMSSKLTEVSEEGIKKGQNSLDESKKMTQLSSISTENLSQLQYKNQSIQGIVKTIQDIASNTNLLAINASIEAAHAGQYGRGFSVIASEVKKLSQKVEDSANQIKEDILAVTKEINLVVEGNDQLEGHIRLSEEKILGTIDEFTKISSESNHLLKQANLLEDII